MTKNKNHLLSSNESLLDKEERAESEEGLNAAGISFKNYHVFSSN